MLMMPVQMLANSMSRSYETVLAAVKDTEGTLLQLQLPLVNDLSKEEPFGKEMKAAGGLPGRDVGSERERWWCIIS